MISRRVGRCSGWLGTGSSTAVSVDARPLPLLVQLACQRPLGGRGPEPGSPHQVANEEQPDYSYGQQDLPAARVACRTTPSINRDIGGEYGN